MIKMSFARSALVSCLLAATSLGATSMAADRVAAPAKAPSLWSRLFGRTKVPTVHPSAAPAGSMPSARSAATSAGRLDADGAVQATWNEPTNKPAGRNVPPAAEANRPPARFPAWLHRKRAPSRTVSEFMAYERP